jgi:predicted nucleotidyltransferase component of viral defense system
MSGIFEQMLSAYDTSTTIAKRNAMYEVMQQIILAGLQRGYFFEKAAFYGGTCLRIFHGLGRYSEDMDFSLLREDSTFRVTIQRT